ncbi:MAG: CoA transferase [Dehalococcoidia bacterium]|nr:CoA transferase [Dehalococcoidia bacterium]
MTSKNTVAKVGSRLPLEGIRVLDLTIYQLGAEATSMLGSLGAEVIKLEPKEHGDPGRSVQQIRGIPIKLPGGHSLFHEVFNRNKKSVAIDLRNPLAKGIVYRLVEKSDVFVQNLRKGVVERLGLDYPTLSKCNPKLIYASGLGFGSQGPEANKPAMDYLGVARSGIMFTSRGSEQPPETFQGGFSDQIGAMYLAYAIMVALVTRERLGVGQEVEVSLLGSMIAVQEFPVTLTLFSGVPYPGQIRERSSNPLWNHYQCKDGKWLAFGHFQSDAWWPAFCRATGLEHLKDDPRFHSQVAREQNNEELIAILDQVFATKSSEEWVQILDMEDLIYTVVNTLSNLADDPQVIANQYIVDLEHPTVGRLKIVAPPIRLSKTPAVPLRNWAPELGGNTIEVLTEIAGFSQEIISEFKDSGAI